MGTLPNFKILKIMFFLVYLGLKIKLIKLYLAYFIFKINSL